MRPSGRLLLLATTALLPAAALAQAPDARPQGGTVVAGQASIARSATRTQVNQASDRAVIEWRGFDIGANQQVDIRQPGAGSWSLQRVTGPDPSAIAGRLTSNGGVALVNPNGITFQGGAQVDVAALIATTSDVSNPNFMAGRLAFEGRPRPGARVENRGTITVRDQGLAALVGPVAANSGTIRARLGRVAIAGAEAFTLDLAGDGLLSLDVTRQVGAAPSGVAALATNTGTIEAEGGHVLLTAQAASGLLETLVSAGGTITAGTVTANAPGGGVLVPAGAAIQATRATIGAGAASTIGAPVALSARTTVERGATVTADSGTAIVHSAQATRVAGTIAARNGRIEVSSRGTIRLDGHLRAPGGTVLVDPEELDIVASLSGSSEPGEITADTVNTTDGFLVLQANRGIRVLAAVKRDAGPLALETTNPTAAAGEGIHIAAPLAVTGDLRLLTAGDITQDAAAALNVTALRAEAGGDVRLEAQQNVIRSLDGGRAGGRFEVASTVDLSVDGALSAASLRLASEGALSLFAPVAATGTAQLVGLGGITQSPGGAGVTGATLVLESAFAPIVLDGAGNGGAVGDVSAPAGVTLRLAGGMSVTGVVNALGATATLIADAGDVAHGGDASRVLADGLAARAPRGSVRLDGAANLIGRIAGSARDDFAIEAGGPLTVAGPIEAARITLGASGDLVQDTDALLVTPLLRARATGGSVLLGDPLNEVTGLGDSAADGAFVLSTMPSLTLAGRIAAPQVALLSGGGLAQGTGTIEATNLRLAALTGEVAMEGANLVAALGASSAAGSFAFATTGALETTDAISAGGTLSLRAASLTLGGDLTAPGVALTATGAIEQSDGRIATASLRAEGDGVRLDAAMNAVEAVSGRGAAAFRLVTATALVADDIVAGSVALTAGGDLTQPAAGVGITADTLAVSAGGLVRLDAAGNVIAALGAAVAPGGLSIATTTTLRLTAPISVPEASLSAGGDLTQASAGTLAAGTLRLSAGGAIRLEEAGNAIPRLLRASAGGELRLAAAGALALEGSVTAGGTVSLMAGDSIAQPAGFIEAPVLIARSVGGSVTLDQPNLVGALGGGAAAGFTFRQGGNAPLNLAALIAAPEVTLTLPGDLFEAGGVLRTEALVLDAGGAVLLDGAGHRVAALAGGRAGALRLATSGPIEVTAPLLVAGPLGLSAEAIMLAAPVAAGAAQLVALSGDIAQSASATLTAGSLQAFAAGSVSLGEANAVRALAGGGAAGSFALATTTPLSVAGVLSAESILLRAGGTMTLDGVAMTAGSAALLAAPGGIAAQAPSTLGPLDAARLPVLVLDTRAAGLTAIPSWLQPDIPGLAPAAQATQLAMFGAPSGAAAGTAAFDLALGASPLFLLLDGGASVGAVEAGRFGLLGQGAGAFLVGAIGGVGGEAASLLAAISGGGADYRFNNCPMGAGCGTAVLPGGEGGGTVGNGGGTAGEGALPGSGAGGDGGSGLADAGPALAPGGALLPGSRAVAPVPVRVGLFTLDPQGQMQGLPHSADAPFAWWLVPLPWPFQPLVETDPPNRR